MRDERIRRMRRAEKVLRRNPTASSYRHSVAFDVLRQRPGKDSNNKAAGA